MHVSGRAERRLMRLPPVTFGIRILRGRGGHGGSSGSAVLVVGRRATLRAQESDLVIGGLGRTGRRCRDSAADPPIRSGTGFGAESHPLPLPDRTILSGTQRFIRNVCLPGRCAPGQTGAAKQLHTSSQQLPGVRRLFLFDWSFLPFRRAVRAAPVRRGHPVFPL